MKYSIQYTKGQNLFNSLYFKYSQKQISLSEIESQMFLYLLKNQNKTILSNWKYDEYEDFLSWFYLRLHKAIDAYKDIKISFEHYIKSHIRMASKEYRTKIAINRIKEYSAWSLHVHECFINQEAPVYYCDEKEKEIDKFITDKKGRKNPKQLLALILKCYYHISDDFIDKIAEFVETDREKLRSMIDRLHALRQKRDDHIYTMKERLNAQFCRCIVLENRMSHVNQNSTAYIALKEQLERAKKRLNNMRLRISILRTEAKNKEIAEVMCISKGTVDSSLHRLKNKRNGYL